MADCYGSCAAYQDGHNVVIEHQIGSPESETISQKLLKMATQKDHDLAKFRTFFHLKTIQQSVGLATVAEQRIGTLKSDKSPMDH